MPRIEIVVAKDGTSPVTLLDLPAKSEGASLKALQVMRFQVHPLSITWDANEAGTRCHFVLRRTVPTRWTESRVRRSVGTVVVPLEFGTAEGDVIASIMWRYAADTTLAPNTRPNFVQYDALGFLPWLGVADTLALYFVVGTLTGTYFVAVDYQLVDVNEFEWERLMQSPIG